MTRLVLVCLMSGAAVAQLPFLPTKTPTRRPTAAPTAAPTRTPTTPPFVPSYTPVPPTATPRPGGATVTLTLGVFIVGATSSRMTPVKYEVETGGVWYTVTPRTGCWTDPGGRCVALGLTPTVRITGNDGAVYQQRLKLSTPRVLLAQAAGPVDLIRFTTPQPQ